MNQFLIIEPTLRNFPNLVRQGARELVANNRERLAAQQTVIARVQSEANTLRLANQGGNQATQPCDAEDSDRLIEQVYSDRYVERKYNGDDSDSSLSNPGSDDDHDDHELPRLPRPAGLFSFSSNSSPLHQPVLPQPRSPPQVQSIPAGSTHGTLTSAGTIQWTERKQERMPDQGQAVKQELEEEPPPAHEEKPKPQHMATATRRYPELMGDALASRSDDEDNFWIVGNLKSSIFINGLLARLERGRICFVSPRARLELQHAYMNVLLTDRDYVNLLLFDAIFPYIMPSLNELYWSVSEERRVNAITDFLNQPISVRARSRKAVPHPARSSHSRPLHKTRRHFDYCRAKPTETPLRHTGRAKSGTPGIRAHLLR